MRAICALSHIAVLPKDTHLGRAAFATVPDLSNPRSLRWAKSSSHQSSRIRSACVKTLALSRFSCADKPLKQSTVLTFPLSKFASVRTALQLFAETRRSFRTLATMAVGQNSDTFFLDKFAFRQFEGGHAGQLKISKENFVREVNSRCTKVLWNLLATQFCADGLMVTHENKLGCWKTYNEDLMKERGYMDSCSSRTVFMASKITSTYASQNWDSVQRGHGTWQTSCLLFSPFCK